MAPTPCPYHQPGGQDCGKREKCPLLQIHEYVMCTALSDHDLAFVRAAVMGRAVGRDEI